MNQPNFDEMDALMGEKPTHRSKGSESRIVDVEPGSTGPRQRKVKSSGNRGAVLALAAIAVVALGAGAAYFALGRSNTETFASPDVVAATLGTTPANVPPAAAPASQPDVAPISDAAIAAAPVAAPPAPAALPAPSPVETELQAKIAALEVELDAAKAAKDSAEKALEEAKNKVPSVVTRDAATSFILIETLIDGAVLRDRAGNEIIVPKGSTVQVAGNRLTAGAAR